MGSFTYWSSPKDAPDTVANEFLHSAGKRTKQSVREKFSARFFFLRGTHLLLAGLIEHGTHTRRLA